jgi:hypothetical protein
MHAATDNRSEPGSAKSIRLKCGLGEERPLAVFFSENFAEILTFSAAEFFVLPTVCFLVRVHSFLTDSLMSMIW